MNEILAEPAVRQAWKIRRRVYFYGWMVCTFMGLDPLYRPIKKMVPILNK